MFRFLNKMINNKKGFTIIEVIVVLALLVIIAAIAVPKFTGIQDEVKIKADKTTATSIIKAARLEHELTGKALTDATGAEYSSKISSNYFEAGAEPQSNTGGSFTLKYDSTTDKYSVTFNDGTKNHTVNE